MNYIPEAAKTRCLAQNFILGEPKRFTRLTGSVIKSMRPIFKTEMLIYQSKANLDQKILFGKINHHLDPEIWEVSERGF